MIYQIFPTTIYVEKLNINLSKEQIDFFKSCQGSSLKNEGNESFPKKVRLGSFEAS